MHARNHIAVAVAKGLLRCNANVRQLSTDEEKVKKMARPRENIPQANDDSDAGILGLHDSLINLIDPARAKTSQVYAIMRRAIVNLHQQKRMAADLDYDGFYELDEAFHTIICRHIVEWRDFFGADAGEVLGGYVNGR